MQLNIKNIKMQKLIILGLISNVPTSIYIVKQSIGGHSIFGLFFGVLLPILSLVFYYSYLKKCICDFVIYIKIVIIEQASVLCVFK